jgi:diguanylate cyclase (GGDEF)-like protein
MQLAHLDTAATPPPPRTVHGICPGAKATPDPLGPRLSAERSLALNQRLQSTLDPLRIIELFSAEVGALIPHQGVRYRNGEAEIDVRLGRRARHGCSNELVLAGKPLGQLTLRRTERFRPSECRAFEDLTRILLYPLHNALLYQDALRMAQRDPLTGVANRCALEETLHRELSHALRHRSSCALMIIDIDHFKAVNDQYGHIVGDRALRVIASRIQQCKRDDDLLFRYGGEEFVIVLRASGLAGAEVLAERIRARVAAAPWQCGEFNIALTVSVGLSGLQDGDSVISLFARADAALYAAKRSGRNRVCTRPESD